jgi:serine/threonine protein phosphatase PrpC
MCTDGVWPALTTAEMLSTLRAYPLERAVRHLMDHAEFRSGAHGDNLSVVAMRYGEEHFEPGELMLSEDFSLEGFTEQLQNLSGKAWLIPETTDQELDRAMLEIQTALLKHGKNNF